MSDIVELKIHGLRLKSPLNGSQGVSRLAMRFAAKTRKQHRRHTRLLVADALWGTKPRPPCIVTLTRLSPGTLDSDNLAGAFKAVRDGVADALDFKSHDRDGPITWNYAQRRGAAREYAVVIEIDFLE